ncbi:large conductance mechanosensitive channel protein MscL [Collinsella sp. AGMB00827]|uniref:Large-conductance mechanosensitive channel n=1 Tax=Collinsella ureilytica TaxID=2869515 RepID=A0ABS7MKM9_9ACTN|nr:large conductance mechanosensitive channel protein MscL [Collinsella urealyticum]MBY4797924.1 large conductance mechanosensitive channel protein MscL [Collinsella urealyticum]
MSQKKTIVQEFMEFISRGNVIDLAVGVIIGGAFTAVVNSLVKNIMQPLISFLTGGVDGVSGLSVNLSGNSIDFSAFISAIINFLLTAAAVFAIIKAMNRFHAVKEAAAKRMGLEKPETPAAPEPRHCAYCFEEIADEATRCPHCTAKLAGYTNPDE